MTYTATPTNVLLYGCGSVGAVYLYQLQQAKCTVTAVCRSNYAQVKQVGFSLRSVRYGNVRYSPDKVIRNISDASDQTFDFVLVCTKSFPGSKPSLADQLRPILEDRPETAIVLAQNGIRIEEEVAAAFPYNPVLSGVVYCPAVQTDPGTIEYPEMLNLLELGTYPANAPVGHQIAAERFAELMIKGGGGAEVHDDIQVARWSKLLMNAAWNPVCALTLCTDGEFLLTSDPFAYDLAWGVMKEIVELAEKVGVKGVTKEVAEKKFRISKRRAETGTGREMSMLQDIKQGRVLEVEAIVGNAVRLGRQYGVKMTRLETIYPLLVARCAALLRQQAKSET